MNQTTTLPLPLKALPALLLAVFSGGTLASGFALQNQTGSGNGNAFAGAAASAEDAGTVYFNPAGMTALPAGQNLSVALTSLKRSINATNNGTSSLNPTVTSTNGGDAGGTALIPALYWSKSLGNDMNVGFGISPTFGNTTEYSTDFFGRYSGYYAEMKQINLNPSLAMKLSPKTSFGFGLNFAKNEITFKQMAPIMAVTGTVAQGAATAAASAASAAYLATNPGDAAGAAAAATAAANNMRNAIVRPDSSVTLEGDGTATGFNFGLLFEPEDGVKLGIAYRSKMKFDLEGTQTVATPPTFASATITAIGGANSLAGGTLNAVQANLQGSTPITAELTTPANLSFALSSQLTRELQMLIDATWTGWSVVNHIPVKRADGLSHPGLTYNFRDTWRMGLGLNYQMNDALKLRFGVAKDQTPVKSAADTTMTLPDSDRTWVSVGAKYAFSKTGSVDFGFTRINFAAASTERAVFFGSTQLQTVKGSFETKADLFSLQYNQNF